MTRTCKGRTIAENGCWLLVCLFVGYTGVGDRESMGWINDPWSRHYRYGLQKVFTLKCTR